MILATPTSFKILSTEQCSSIDNKPRLAGVGFLWRWSMITATEPISDFI